jgi:zinc protease
VVIEERRMRTDDDPQSLTYEQFLAAAYISSPYRVPVIGWRNDLENMTVTDLKRWYETWYAPNNATLVVVGDVNPDEVLQLAQRYYGPVPSRPIPTLKPQQEVTQLGIRRIHVQAPAELPSLIMGYKVPVVKTAQQDWEPYALDMLAGILDGGASARFAKELVRGKQVAAQAGAGYDLYDRLESLFILSGTPAQEHSVDDLEQAIRAQIERLKTEPVGDDELERIKTQVIAGNEYQKDSAFFQARQIGVLESVGLDWRLMDQYVERLRAVTPEQIQAVARKYLCDDSLTIATLDPQPINGDSATGAQ